MAGKIIISQTLLDKPERTLAHIERTAYIKDVVMCCIRSQIDECTIPFIVLNDFKRRCGKVIVDHRQRPLGVLLDDYGKKLRADPKYPPIYARFKTSGVLSLSDDEAKQIYSSMLEEFFLVLVSNAYVADQIMMVFAVSTNLVKEALENNHSQRAFEISKWTLDVLDKNYIGLDGPLSWLAQYDSLVDPQRECNLISDQQLLTKQYTVDVSKLPETSSKVVILPTPVALPGTSLQATTTPNLVPGRSSGVMWYDKDPRVRKTMDFSQKVTHLKVLQSFVMDRLRKSAHFGYAGPLLKLYGKKFIDLSIRKLGVALDDIAHVIEKTPAYKKLAEIVIPKLSGSTDIGRDLLPFVHTYIAKYGYPILYDQIVALFVLFNDLIIEALKTSQSPAEAHKILKSCCDCVKSNGIKAGIISAGWEALPELKEDILQKKRFIIMTDMSLLDKRFVLPPPVLVETDSYPQKQPYIDDPFFDQIIYADPAVPLATTVLQLPASSSSDKENKNPASSALKRKSSSSDAGPPKPKAPSTVVCEEEPIPGTDQAVEHPELPVASKSIQDDDVMNVSGTLPADIFGNGSPVEQPELEAALRTVQDEDVVNVSATLPDDLFDESE